MPSRPLKLDQDYTIDTPENVSFSYDIAGIGNRFIGALIDSIIVTCLMVVLNILLMSVLYWDNADFLSLLEGEDTSWLGGFAIALFALLQFIIFWGYYTLFEFLWNGQTPGKRLVKIRVLRLDGNPIGFVEAFLRNLVRPVDFLPSGYALGLVVMFSNEKSRRLGDWAAGTIVVRMRADLSLDALVESAGRERQPEAAESSSLLLEFPQIRELSMTDYELIREMLARKWYGGSSNIMLRRLARAIATRLDKPRPTSTQASVNFLTAVAEAYRQLQSQDRG